MAAVGVVAVLVRDRRPPLGASSLAAAAGVGLMIGLGGIAYFLGLAHLPVSVAATLGNAYVLVTTALAVVLRGQTLGRWQIAGAVATVAGVYLLTATG
jgi:drug/metabolite transporter (DMT)-like permease